MINKITVHSVSTPCRLRRCVAKSLDTGNHSGNCPLECIQLTYIKSIDMLNKNTPGVKKSEAKSEAPESYSYKRLKSVISGGGQGPSCLLATM